MKKLDDLPPLADLSDWESLRVQLNLPDVDEDTAEQPEEAESGGAVVTPLHVAGRDPGVKAADSDAEAQGADGEAAVPPAEDQAPQAASVEGAAAESADETSREAVEGGADEDETDYQGRGDSSASSA